MIEISNVLKVIELYLGLEELPVKSHYTIRPETGIVKSEGALYRIGINLISAFIFLLIIRNRVDNIFDKRIYTILSFIAIVLFLVSFHASTFADRFNYYIFPLHLYTLTHFISLFKDRYVKILLSVMTICLYFGILNIWLFFGNTSSTWIPYKMFPFSYRVDSCLHNDFSCQYIFNLPLDRKY